MRKLDEPVSYGFSDSDMLPPLSERLKWGLLVRLPDRAKHKRAIPVCPTVLLDIMIVWNFFRKDQEIFFSVSSIIPDIRIPSLHILIAAF